MDRPEPKYARSGDLSIAYVTVGDGPLDIVYVPGFISHADLFGLSHCFARSSSGSRPSGG